MTRQYLELLLWRCNFMGITTLLPVFVCNIIRYNLWVWNHPAFTFINNLTLLFALHSIVYINHWGNGWNLLAIIIKRGGSIWNHGHDMFLMCGDFLLIMIQLDWWLPIILVYSSNTLAALKSCNAVSKRCLVASKLASVFVSTVPVWADLVELPHNKMDCKLSNPLSTFPL